VTKLRDAEKELAALRQAQLLQSAARFAEAARDVGGVRVVTADVGEVASADDLRTLVLDVRERLGQTPAVVALGGVAKQRPLVVVATNPGARAEGVKAGTLVRVAAGRLGGGGGGKDDVAQGGGNDASALGAALEDVVAAVARR
jgi:alanyl-tRNA synthetase